MSHSTWDKYICENCDLEVVESWWKVNEERFMDAFTGFMDDVLADDANRLITDRLHTLPPHAKAIVVRASDGYVSSLIFNIIGKTEAIVFTNLMDPNEGDAIMDERIYEYATFFHGIISTSLEQAQIKYNHFGGRI